MQKERHQRINNQRTTLSVRLGKVKLNNMKSLKKLKKETKRLEAELERKLKERQLNNNIIKFLKDLKDLTNDDNE